MTHEELLKKYNVNATEFNEQKEEIANIFLKELANMQQAEAEGLGFKLCFATPVGIILKDSPYESPYVESPSTLSNRFKSALKVSFRIVPRRENV